ncbi:m7GpppX diphosphatase-like [Ylistrum balloti]|uniref:m7GpppX diphosphatase-like n=1 Tax=Ylistrum balloti TaxID=509963 RepID=UPI002905827B|nr:m7GpppX diphosphatase-like [Ylistrum balloti]
MAAMDDEKAIDLVTKKRKLQNEEEACHQIETRANLGNMDIVGVLNDNPREKCLFLHTKISGDDAVVLMEKTPFDTKTLTQLISQDTSLKETLKNDIYSTFETHLPYHLNVVKTTLIHPATAKHLSKYRQQKTFAICETEEMYKNVTKPFLQEQKFSIQWVYNILDKKSESDRIVFEDACPKDGFVLLPDMKWNRKDLSQLYLVAIVHNRDILSLRDLNHTHLPMLNNILHKGMEAIRKQFTVMPSKLRVYVHYQPSYHHFHVHFTHLDLDAPGFEADRAHLLQDIIDNITIKSDYYQKKSIVFKLRECDGLYIKYKESRYFN